MIGYSLLNFGNVIPSFIFISGCNRTFLHQTFCSFPKKKRKKFRSLHVVFYISEFDKRIAREKVIDSAQALRLVPWYDSHLVNAFLFFWNSQRFVLWHHEKKKENEKKVMWQHEEKKGKKKKKFVWHQKPVLPRERLAEGEAMKNVMKFEGGGKRRRTRKKNNVEIFF